MASNQQQTDLPQETSPHHVYGNQHFSRDLLIASEGEGEELKNNWILPDFQPTVHCPDYDVQAQCQNVHHTMLQHTV